MLRKKKPTPPPAPAYPKTMEVFGEPWLGSIAALRAPSCYNGIVVVKRYRITVEEIPEEPEVIVARIRQLWAESNNHHHTFPLRQAAKEYGVELNFDDKKNS